MLVSLPNETYIGTMVGLYCTVQLDSAVNTAVQVATYITSDSGEANSSTLAMELGNNTYESSLVFSPLTSEDGNEYVCNVTVEPSDEYVLGATAQAMFSLLPLSMQPACSHHTSMYDY